MVQTEKEALSRCSHPNIIHLHAGFQDAHFLYMVLDYAQFGELFSILQHFGGLNLEIVRFVAAEIAAALHYLRHVAYIIHLYPPFLSFSPFFFFYFFEIVKYFYAHPFSF